jgi:hypothetical protein
VLEMLYIANFIFYFRSSKYYYFKASASVNSAVYLLSMRFCFAKSWDFI